MHEVVYLNEQKVKQGGVGYGCRKETSLTQNREHRQQDKLKEI